MLGPGRCWLLPAEGWPVVPFLHGVRDTAVRDKARTRRTSGRIYRKALMLEIMKRRIQPSVGIWWLIGHHGGVSPIWNGRRDY
jgi:hypothetical protein